MSGRDDDASYGRPHVWRFRDTSRIVEACRPACWLLWDALAMAALLQSAVRRA